MHSVTQAHLIFEKIKKQVKLIQETQRRNGDIADLRKDLDAMTDIPAALTAKGGGKVAVKDGVVYYDGEVIHNAISERIIWGLSEGFDMTPYTLFLSNIMENPSKRSVEETYTFMERNNMGITDDGHILAYKRVRHDYKDIHSGTFDNSVGRVVEMPRNKVDDQKERTCSTGLHFCSLNYLPHYKATDDNRVVIVKVNPRDVVSVPSDYNAAKVRCCRYEVIGELEGDALTDILATKPVWTERDWATGQPGDDLDDWSEGDAFDEDWSEDEIEDEDVSEWDEDVFEDEDEEDSAISREGNAFSIDIGSMPASRAREHLESIRNDTEDEGDDPVETEGPQEPFDVVRPISFLWVAPSGDFQERDGTILKINFNAAGEPLMLVRHETDNADGTVQRIFRSYRLMDVEKVTDLTTGEVFPFTDDLIQFLLAVRDEMPPTSADQVDVAAIVENETKKTVTEAPVSITYSFENGRYVLTPTTVRPK